jgi:hypothetical protein
MNKLVQGGWSYRSFHFSEDSLFSCNVNASNFANVNEQLNFQHFHFCSPVENNLDSEKNITHFNLLPVL